jgi:hypothetical protein
MDDVITGLPAAAAGLVEIFALWWAGSKAL